ncbi:MAG: GldG family protein [Chloroflexi bacterium]|nr:GldG family protein [Chloroflexota bacterium]
MARSTQGPPTTRETGETVFATLTRLLSGRQGISAIGAVAGGLALLLGLVLLLFVPAMRGAAYSVVVLGAILLLLALMVSFSTVVKAVTGRRGRYGTNTTAMVVAFVVLGILIEVLAFRNPVRWDLTATRRFSLAPQTRDILTGLQEPVRATAFFVAGNPSQDQYRTAVEDLMKEFGRQQPKLFSFRFLDPDREVTIAKEFDIRQYPAVVFEGRDSGLRHQLIAPFFEERNFATAMLIATGRQQKRLYYLTGHGEKDLGDVAPDSREGAALLASGLGGDNYDVQVLSLAQIPLVPEDAAALIIAGPKQDLEGEESKILEQYLRGGGRVLFLLEPNPPATFSNLLFAWGIKPVEGRVVEIFNSVAGQPQTPLFSRDQYFRYPEDPSSPDPFHVDLITRPLDETYFPGTAAFQQRLPPEEMVKESVALFRLVRATVLSCISQDPEAKTCPPESLGRELVPAWALQGFAPINEKPDPAGPRKTRIVVFGDSDFVSNYHIPSKNNRDLVLNAVNWLTEDTALANIRPNPIPVRYLILAENQKQLLRALSWFVLPAGVVLLAAVAWWRRR